MSKLLGVTLRVEFLSRTRSGEPTSRLVWQVEEKLRSKCRDTILLLQGPNCTRRSIARAIGIIIWVKYVYGVPLIRISDVLDVARKNAPSRPGKSQWDMKASVTEDDKATLEEHLNEILTDRSWHQPDDKSFDSTQSLRIVTDSSGSRGAYVIFDANDQVIDQRFWSWKEHMPGFENSSIFLKELLAATIAVERAAVHKAPIHLAIDNSAAGFVIQRGISTIDAANEMVKRIYDVMPDFFIRVTHIRSLDNAADPLTRDRPINPIRNMASLSRMKEAESGWPKCEKHEHYTPNDGDDDESDSDEKCIRHR